MARRPPTGLPYPEDLPKDFYGQKTSGRSPIDGRPPTILPWLARRFSTGLLLLKVLCKAFLEDLLQVFFGQKDTYRSSTIFNGMNTSYRSSTSRRPPTRRPPTSKSSERSSMTRRPPAGFLWLEDLLQWLEHLSPAFNSQNVFNGKKTSYRFSVAKRPLTGLLWLEDLCQDFWDQKISHRTSGTRRPPTDRLWPEDILHVFYDQKTS